MTATTLNGCVIHDMKNQIMKWFIRISSLVLVLLMMPILVEGECDASQSSCYQDGSDGLEYTYQVMKNDTGGWYYTINKAGKPFITQKNIPAINKNVAFQDSIQSFLVAKKVVEKLEKGIFPPSITISELQKLQINY